MSANGRWRRQALVGVLLAGLGAMTALAQPYTLRLYVVGNGTVAVDNPSGTYGPSEFMDLSYAGGETVHLTPTSGTLVGWTGDGTGSPVRTVVMTADRVVAATFTALDGNCDADCVVPSGMPGQVNIIGATLFVDFFKAPAGTNDWIDVDQDGVCGDQGINTDQLAANNPCSFVPNHWVVNYRGVGSGNGLAELINWQCNGLLPSVAPSDEGWTNRFQRSLLGVQQGGGGDVFFQCPVQWDNVRMAVSDVPSSWFFRQEGAGAWSKRPGQAGYWIGGNETFITYGSPMETDPGSVNYMESQSSADFLRNILCSVRDATQGGSTEYNMPGEFLANNYFLAATITYLPNIPDCCFGPNPNLNVTLQSWVAENHAGITPDFGTKGVTTPVRTNTVAYEDGAPIGALGYRNPFDLSYGQPIGGTSYSLAYKMKLNPRNHLSGDFDGNGSRNLNDISVLMAAVQNPVAWATTHSVATDPVVPEIIGDFDGDGNFDSQDVRYFADGLALDPNTGNLDRKQGFVIVDQSWLALTGDVNYFGTTLATGKVYAAGDSRGDVAGNSVSRGADPTGSDGVINCVDVAYVYTNFGSWANLDQAAGIDLSCDMNGDLVVDFNDVLELTTVILGTSAGDANLDGHVDAADLAIVKAHFGQAGGWCDGDFNGNGVVDGCDVAAASDYTLADMNCDGVVNNFDINPYVLALTNPAAYQTTYPNCNFSNADCNCDGVVNNFDINVFVQMLTR